MKKGILVLCLALCLAALSGCTFRQVDELYTLPKLAGDYQNLQAKIEEVTTGTGAEYSAPLWGKYTQPVQFQDLNGDNELEALAFFKVSGEEKPLKIYIFRPTEEGYEVGAVIEGEGNAIYSIDYEDLNSTPAKELVVSWQRGTDVNTLTVFSVDRFEVAELMSTVYTGYDLTDIDMDNQKEVMVINIDTVDGTKSRVDCYDANKASLERAGSAPLSQGIISLDTDHSVRTGNLRGDTPVPAYFVTSGIGEGTIVTDIFAWGEDTIKNITISAETGVSTSTTRVKDKARASDIDRDSVLELPVPVNQKPSGATSMPVLDAWYQYDIRGNAHLVYTTYHNFEDGWYFVLPQDWVGKVAVTQDSMVVGEKRVSFSAWQGERTENFLTVYRLTGPNRHMRARMGERFTVHADDTTIYCAEFVVGGWDGGLDAAGVKDHFKLTQTEW